MAAVKLDRVSKVFSDGPRETLALSELSFDVADHEFVCLVGPSGCGKTTLLRLVAGLEIPTHGSVQVDRQQAGAGPTTTLVFQSGGLFPWLTVLDNAALALEFQDVGPSERRNKALAFIAKLGIGEFGDNYPHQLSGGMRQRVAVARAFLAEAGVLLMDEPFGALDAQTRLVLQEELLGLWRSRRKTVLYVTHDIEEAIFLADRILVMSGRPGRILETIPIEAPRAGRSRQQLEPTLVKLRDRIWQMLRDEVRRELHIQERRP